MFCCIIFHCIFGESFNWHCVFLKYSIGNIGNAHYRALLHLYFKSARFFISVIVFVMWESPKRHFYPIISSTIMSQWYDCCPMYFTKRGSHFIAEFQFVYNSTLKQIGYNFLNLIHTGKRANRYLCQCHILMIALKITYFG